MLVMNISRVILLAVAVFAAGGPRTAFAADAAALAAALESIRSDDLRKHANVLASDTFEGREAGTQGGKAAGVYLVKLLQKLGIQGAGIDAGYYQSFGHSIGADFRNILAVIPGSDPKLKHEYILIGAHYDHVGYGTVRNSHGPIGYIHNGADDNASGTAGLLEIVEAFTLLGTPKRSLLIVFWDAEEKGLLGSEHWLTEPTIKLEQVRLVLNLDMIGRLRGDTLAIFGTRTAPGLRRLVSEQNFEKDLRLDFDWDIIRDSDHHPFFMQRVPFLAPYTRKHEDYHRPSDDVDKLNLAGMQQATRLMFRVTVEAADRPELPPFRPAAANENQTTQQQYLAPLPPSAPAPPRLGVSWDKTLAERRIIQLTAIAPNSPASKAGLKVGDRVVEFGGVPMESVNDFRLLAQRLRNPVSVVIQRGNEDAAVRLEVDLEGEPVSLGIAWRPDDAEPDCVVVARVIPGTPAESAGLQLGDRIYAVSDRSFRSSEEFRRLISETSESLELLVERLGRMSRVRIPNGVNPRPMPMSPAAGDNDGDPREKAP
jgi:hypothetical protein